MTKRVFAILLAVLMCVAVFAGCNGNTPASSAAPAESKAESKAEPESQAEPEPEADPLGADFAGYPIDTDETLSFYVFAGYAVPDGVSRKDNAFEKSLVEATGVDIDWIEVPAGGDAEQSFNLMLSSSEMPDMFYKGSLTKSVTQLIDDGVVLDLSEQLPVYAPAYYQFITADPECDKACKNDAGQYYGFVFLREDLYLGTYTGPALRKDLLDKVGKEAPVTLDDWTATLTAFKDIVKYPYTARSVGDLASAFLGAWGMRSGFYVGADQKVHYAQAEAGYKEFLTLMNQWYNDGLFDPDFLTNDYSALETKALNSEIGGLYMYEDTIDEYRVRLEAMNIPDKWTAVTYPVLNAGETSLSVQGETHNIGIVGCITTSCKNVPLACRFLDYGYTEEGTILYGFGTEGDCWELQEDGTHNFTEAFNNNEKGLNYMLKTYTGMEGNAATLCLLEAFLIKPDFWQDCAKTWYTREGVSNILPGSLTMTTDESTAIANEATAIDTLAGEMAPKFILGQESLDGFDAFVDSLNAAGLEHVLSVYNDAYTRYLGR